MRRCAGFVPTLLLLGTPLFGQTPRLVSDVDTTMVSVGDRITLRISVDHPPAATVVWPDTLNLEPFEVLTGRAEPPVPQGETVRSSLALTLTAFELGDLEIPSFPVEVVEVGGASTVLHTSPFGIQVSSVGLDEGGDIRQLKGPLGIPVGLGRILTMALAAILALGAAYLLFRKIRRKGPESITPIQPPPSRPPHEVALEAFRRLEASPLLGQGRIKEFHIQASEILRAYVEGRFGVPALEMTTSDITGGLERIGSEPLLVEEFRTFLHACDMVKFAKYRPTDEVSNSLPEAGRRLVEKTIPAPIPSVAVQAEAGTTPDSPGTDQDRPALTPAQPAVNPEGSR